MSEYDEPGRSEDSATPAEGSRQQHYQQPYAHNPYGQPYDQAYRQGPSQPAQNPYAQQTMPLGYYQPPARQPQAKVSGWVWPMVAATALVVGLLGGIFGGIAVSSSMNDDPVGAFETGTGTDSGPGIVAPPLDPENGSVAAVAKALLPSTVQILARQDVEGEAKGATGSGFVLDRNGHVITNNHVVSAAAEGGEIEVIDQDGKVRSAEIVGRSPVYDIAVLKVEQPDGLLPAAVGSSKSMNVGETVVALGSPLGLDSTVTSGIVSALDRPVTTGDQDGSSYINAVQTDAAINPGNSGGPLVNLRGQVVGVNSAIATTGGFGGDGNIGVGFAIPMEQVRITAGQILANGEAEYPVIGAFVVTGGPERDGAKVTEVKSGGPADDAGLEEGDIVRTVDDVPVTDGIALIVAIRSHQPGETITLRAERDGREVTFDVTLDAEVDDGEGDG